jgi:hypothetical protein
MADIFVDHRFESPADAGALIALLQSASLCLTVYRIGWHEGFLSGDRRYMLSHFQAPDTESVRIALRQRNLPADAVWPGVLEPGPHPAGEEAADINLMADYRVAGSAADPHSPVVTPPAAEPCGTGIVLVMSILAADHRRRIVLCHASDTAPWAQATVAAGRLWPCTRLCPARSFRAIAEIP